MGTARIGRLPAVGGADQQQLSPFAGPSDVLLVDVVDHLEAVGDLVAGRFRARLDGSRSKRKVASDERAAGRATVACTVLSLTVAAAARESAQAAGGC